MGNSKDNVASPVATLLSMESFQPAFKRSSLLAGAVLGGTVAISPLAYAEESAVTLDKVEVSGEREATLGYQANKASSNKFTAPLVDTPKSVTVIPESVIKDRGATSLKDVLRTTPGITLGSGEGGTPNGDRPFIRGYEASTDIFIDGLRDYGRGSHETFNLESVEVIKGPSSAYTGRGGTGGSLNLQTKRPGLSNFAEVTGGIGTDGQWRTTFDGNYAFTDNSAFRMNMMKMGGDMPGRDVVEYDRIGFAPSLAFGLGTPTRIILSYSHIENDDTPDWGIPFRNDANPNRDSPIKPDRENYYGRAGVDYNENQFDTATVDLEHDINDNVTVRNVTRWSKSRNEYLFTRPSFDNCNAGDAGSCATEDAGLEFTRSDRSRWRENEALINQTELRGEWVTGAFKHQFFVGAEFSKEEIFSRDGIGGPGESTDSFWDPNPHQNFGPRNLAFGSKYKNGEIKTSSVYAFDTIELNPQWLVNLGLRYDDFRVKDSQSGESNHDAMWNYQAGVVYKPAENGSIYLSYGTSSNPAGENFGQAGGADGPAGGAKLYDLEPERSRSWELGTKWDVFNERLSLTAAVFQTDKTDARSADPITGDVTSSGDNRVRGFEVGAAGAITEKWDVWAGYTYLDPKITKYRSQSRDGTFNVFDGNQMKFIAKNNATLWTTYQIAPKWTIGGGATYVGKRYVNDDNTLHIPSHTVYDAMVRYDVNNNLSLHVNANNLSDERVFDASHVGLFANVGPGRSYMFNATYRFE